MKKAPFVGSAVALVTPFIDDEVDFDALGELIDIQIAHKTDAIVVCGTTGEASTMPSDEHMKVIEYAVQKINKRVPLIAGTGSNDTHHASNMSALAEKAGADAILSVTPYYNKSNKNGLFEHYKKIAGSISLPIILYNVPSRTGVSIDIDTLGKLAEIDNIVAIKEASGSLSFAAKIAANIPELCIYSGNDDIITPMLSIGAKGVISVAANIFPEEIHNICRYFFDGSFEQSKKIQLDLLDAINLLFVEVNPVPIKTAMQYLGYPVGNLRLPLGKMSDENFEKIKTMLANYKVSRLH